MRRLLVAYDFSQGSGHALLRALRLAARNGAALRLVHAVEESVPQSDPASTRRRLLTEARIMAEETGSTNVNISASVRSGNAAAAILAEAEALDADLLILGGHGAPRFRDALFGTTATHVARHSDRALLIAQMPGGEAYTQAMIAIDDPLASEPLLTTAFAVAPHAEIVAVHAFSPSFGQTIAGSAELGRQEERLERQIQDLVSAAAPGGPGRHAAASIQTVVETGDVLTVLMKTYEAFQPGLLAVGTRARATFLGSNAVDTLFWCPHDVLIVPDRARIMPPAVMATPLEA